MLLRWMNEMELIRSISYRLSQSWYDYCQKAKTLYLFYKKYKEIFCSFKNRRLLF